MFAISIEYLKKLKYNIYIKTLRKRRQEYEKHI